MKVYRCVLVLILLVLTGCQAEQIPEPQPEEPVAELSSNILPPPEPPPVTQPPAPQTPEIETLTIDLPGTDLTVDVRIPNSPHFEIVNVIQDETSGEWAVLGVVTNFGNGDNPAWHRGNFLIQLFDEGSKFIKLINIPLNPITDYANEIKSEPIVFNEHILSFFTGNGISYTFVDTQTEEISSIQAYDCVAHGDYFILRSWSESGRPNIFQLFHGMEFISTIEIELPNWYANNSVFDGYKALTITPGENRTAALSAPTLSYTLDFNSGTYEMRRHYTLEDLDHSVTSNDRWEIYNANIGRFEGGFWGEVVVHDKHTGEFKYLHDRYAYSAAIGKGDALLVSETWGLKLFDLGEMRLVRDLLPVTEEQPLDRVISGVAYDGAREMFVVAWLSYEGLQNASVHVYEYSTNVLISTYSTSGELLRTFDSGVEMRMYPRLYSILGLEIALDGQGNVLFRDRFETDAAFHSIRYWD